MADVINKQKKVRSASKRTYYAAQFAQTLKNKARKKKRAALVELKHQMKLERRRHIDRSVQV